MISQGQKSAAKKALYTQKSKISELAVRSFPVQDRILNFSLLMSDFQQSRSLLQSMYSTVTGGTLTPGLCFMSSISQHLGPDPDVSHKPVKLSSTFC